MLTIMTPTLNRAYILPKAYESLKKQTCFDFEWVIVDDGSSDDTESLVKGWLAENNPFPIRYEKQKNGGKHRAVNRGVALASYDYFLILDSDDQLTEDAVQTIHTWITQIDGLEGFAGVAGLKGSETAAVGGTPKQPYIDATNLERQKYGLMGDKAEIYKTEVMRQYPFPEFEGENFLRENAVWDRIAMDGWKLRWFSQVIYLCEYIADGLTQNTNANTYIKNFQGFTYCTKLYLQTRSGMQALNKLGEFHNVAKGKDLSAKESIKLLEVKPMRMLLGRMYFGARQMAKSILSRNAKH